MKVFPVHTTFQSASQLVRGNFLTNMQIMAIKCALKKKDTNTWVRQIGEYMTRRLTHTRTTWMHSDWFLWSLYRAIPGADVRRARPWSSYPRKKQNNARLSKNIHEFVRSKDCRLRGGKRFYAVFKVVMHFLQILLAEPVRAVSAAAAAAAYSSTTWGSVRVTVLWDLVHKSIVGSFRGRRVCDVRPCFHQTWYEIDRCTFGPARFQQIRPNFFPFFFFLSPT